MIKVEPYLEWLASCDNDPSLGQLLVRYNLVSSAIRRHREAKVGVPIIWLYEVLGPSTACITSERSC